MHAPIANDDHCWRFDGLNDISNQSSDAVPSFLIYRARNSSRIIWLRFRDLPHGLPFERPLHGGASLVHEPFDERRQRVGQQVGNPHEARAIVRLSHHLE